MVGPHVQRREGANGNNRCHWRCHSSEVLPWFLPHCTSLSKNFFVVTPFIIIVINKNQVGGAFIVVGRYQTKLGRGFQENQPDKAWCHHQTRDHCPLSSTSCLNLVKYISMVILVFLSVQRHWTRWSCFTLYQKCSLLEREKSNPVSFQFFSIKIKRSRQQIYRVD